MPLNFFTWGNNWNQTKMSLEAMLIWYFLPPQIFHFHWIGALMISNNKGQYQIRRQGNYPAHATTKECDHLTLFSAEPWTKTADIDSLATRPLIKPPNCSLSHSNSEHNTLSSERQSRPTESPEHRVVARARRTPAPRPEVRGSGPGSAFCAPPPPAQYVTATAAAGGIDNRACPAATRAGLCTVVSLH